MHRLLPGDAGDYRQMRLEALQRHPGWFGNSHAMEAGFPDEFWTGRLASPDGACFGLYREETLIGITAIRRQEADREEGYLNQSYIRVPWRGRGLSAMLYEARLGWAREQGLKRLVISHRRSNTVSRAANQRFGFRYTHTESRLWPDGCMEDNLFYVLEL